MFHEILRLLQLVCSCDSNLFVECRVKGGLMSYVASTSFGLELLVDSVHGRGS